MKTLDAVLTIAKKDLLLSFRDKTGVALGFGLPIVLVLAFGFIYQMTFGRPGGVARTTLWCADADDTEESAAFVTALRESPMLIVNPPLGKAAKSAAELEDLVRDGEAHHALVIPAGFGRAIRAGELPPLRLLRDPGREMESQLVSIGLMQAMMTSGGANLSPALTTRAMIQAGLPEEFAGRMTSLAKGFSMTIGALFSEAGVAFEMGSGTGPLPSAPVTTSSTAPRSSVDMNAIFTDLIPVEKVDFQPPNRPRQLTYMLSHNLAGIAQMMLMFGLVACATLLLQERDSGTLRRLLVAPVSANSLLLGKLVFMAIMGAIQLVILFAVGSLVFGVNVMRDPITLIALSAALIFAITAFGILIATLARSAKQAEGFSTLIILLMSALGGAWFPLAEFDIPLAGQIVSRCTLTHWAMHGFQGMLYHGHDLTDPLLLLDIGVMVGFGTVALAIAMRAFRSRFVS